MNILVMNSRDAKLLKIIGIYAVLICLVAAASFATSNVEFNHYQTLGSPAVQAENYFGQFFEAGWLVAGIGCLFALIWAVRIHHQRRHAKWFKYAITITSILTFFGVFISVGFSRIDCGDSCAWYVLPRGIAYIMGTTSTLFWFGASMLIYKFMLSNSSLD